jgi:X-X-X-Leu-X-X-Gly heptad repeat protein
MNTVRHRLRAARQRGISLVTTLVMMVAVMVLGLSAIMISKGEFVLSGNLQFQTGALNEAESSVIAAEQWLAAGTNYLSSGFTTYASGTAQLYPVNYMSANSIDPLVMDWSDSNSTQVAGQTLQRYLIELLATNKTLIPTSLTLGGRATSGCNRVNVYRIIARGGSGRGATRFVQSIYSRLSC